MENNKKEKLMNCTILRNELIILPFEELNHFQVSIKDEMQSYLNQLDMQKLIGCLMYLTATRPHILYDLSVLSRFLNSPSELHIQDAKRVLRYITGSMDYDMKSTSGYGFIFGAGYVSCCSKKKRDCCSINCSSRIHCCYSTRQSSFMDKENLMRSLIGNEGKH